MQGQPSPNRLLELRRLRNLRLVHVAAAADKDQSTVWRYEQGKSEVPDDVKARLAEFYGVTRAYLMGWDEDEPAKPVETDEVAA